MTATLRGLLERLKPDLVLTYNWGSIDGAAAVATGGYAPLIHTEDGFNQDEAERQKVRRILWRRLALRTAYRVVAISETLRELMASTWKLPKRKLLYIPNGIDTVRFLPAKEGSWRREVVIGTVANLVPVKNQALLLRACAGALRGIEWRLVIAGDGPERGPLGQLAVELDLGDRVEFLGRQSDVVSVYHRLDIFALSSRSEQMPLSVLEAMACGLPVLSTSVGDVKRLVSEENRSLITVGESEYAAALSRLAGDAALRVRVGLANRARAETEHDAGLMCRRYLNLYEEAINLRAPSHERE